MFDDRVPVESAPWRPEDGPKPRVRSWPPRERPALWVWSGTAWRWAPVLARQDWEDGRIVLQVVVDLDGSTTVAHRAYMWPHPGLRVAERGGRSATTE